MKPLKFIFVLIVLSGAIYAIDTTKNSSDSPNSPTTIKDPKLPIKFGPLVLGGNGCTAPNLQYSIKAGILSIPNGFVNTQTNKNMERKSCHAAIPILIPPQYRLMITELKQPYALKLTAYSHAEIHNEIFVTGQNSPPILYQFDSQAHVLSKKGFLTTTKTLLATFCSDKSESYLLRLNSSSLLEGTGNSRMAISASQLKIRILSCF